ncbi:hypothetical protein WA026_008631 [Henosepilachna vigintioctopunctata]|uniref:CRAL-TRIO domain-containing protein n=1 Tax=Henosepilachna vigintioctopunctata TaxID=420089 RepID=A0AAW1UH06_9CUCU
MSKSYVCELPIVVQNYAEKMLNETEVARQNGFKEIKKWAADNPHLHIRTDEKYILPFLRGCKFNLDKTKKKMENFYLMRRDRTEWFKNRNVLSGDIGELVKMGCLVVLKETHENQVVIIIRATAHDPKKHSLNDVLKGGKMILDVAVSEYELAQVYGVIAIIDMTNVKMGHAKQLSLTQIKHMVFAWQNYYCRPQRIQFVNAPHYINIFLDIFKKFMSEKLSKRVHVSYSGNSSLASIVDRSILPKDYGGDGETIEELGSYWYDKLVSYADWFAEDEKYKAE